MVNRRRRSRSSAQPRADQLGARRHRMPGRRMAEVWRDPRTRTGILAVAAVCCSLAILQPSPAMGQQVVPAPVMAPSVADTQPDGSHLQGLKEYVNTSVEPVEISQLGILARDGDATLDDGEKIAGVAVVDVSSKGAAANALGTHETSHLLVGGVLLGAGVASAVLFPPALIGVLILANSHVGMSYDLVVGVDGLRVRNTMEFMQSVADARPGDTLYLVI